MPTEALEKYKYLCHWVCACERPIEFFLDKGERVSLWHRGEMLTDLMVYVDESTATHAKILMYLAHTELYRLKEGISGNADSPKIFADCSWGIESPA